MQSMKTKKGIAAAGIVLVLCAGFWYFCKPVYYRLYPFDRIRGNIQVVVDGEVCTLSEESFTDCRKVKLYDDGSASIGIQAGKYGAYTFTLHPDVMEQPVTFRCFQHNWWNVRNFDVLIAIDTQQDSVAISGTAIDIDDFGRKCHDDFAYSYDTAEEIKVSFGP